MGFHLDHVVLNVRDVDASIRFYCDVVGLSVERLEEFGRGTLPFPSVRVNADTIIDLLPPALWSAAGQDSSGHENMNHLCLAIDGSDWGGLAARLERAAINIESGPMVLSGARGDGTAVYVRDPDGNRVEIRYYES